MCVYICVCVCVYMCMCGKGPNLASRVGAVGPACCYGQESNVLQELDERLHCHHGRRKEMFYLTMHSTHFIYGYMASDIWLRTILIVRKGNPLPPHRLLFPINSKVFFICTIPQTGYGSTYHSLCYTSRGALAGTRNSSMGPPHEGSIR